jgi:hypothetical protein
MSDPELRQVISHVDRALALFREHDVMKLSADETRARLSLAGARRQLEDELVRLKRSKST